MKRIKFLMVACLLGIASTASAQFVNASSTSAASGNSNAESWEGLRVSYHPVSFEADGGGSIDLSGASIGYVKSFGVSATAPLFIETGANVSWIGGDLGDSEIDLNVFSVNVPVNFGYKYAFSESASIFPYAGLTLRGNVFGNYKEDGESYNAFDEDEVTEDDLLKRFQIGWQIGIGATFNTFYVGVSYGNDFNEIANSIKVSMPSITIGFNM